MQGTIAPATDPNLILIKAAVSQPNGSLIFTQPTANTAVNATKVEMYTIGYNGAEQIQYDPDNVPYKVTYRWQIFRHSGENSDRIAHARRILGKRIQ